MPGHPPKSKVEALEAAGKLDLIRYRNIDVQVSEATFARLMELVRAAGVSRNEYLRRAIEWTINFEPRLALIERQLSVLQPPLEIPKPPKSKRSVWADNPEPKPAPEPPAEAAPKPETPGEATDATA